MEHICLGSGSKGNAYIIKNKDTTLLVECGFTPAVLRQKMIKSGVLIQDIDAVVVTHSHNDHVASAKFLSDMVPIIASGPTHDKANTNQWNRYIITNWTWYDIKTIRTWAFEVDHDCEGSMGYIFEDLTTKEKTLFINDTGTVRWNFGNMKFETIMIECNHITSTTQEGTRDTRARNTHMSLDVLKVVLSKLDLEKTRSIYLMHLSNDNSDERRMINEIKELTGKETYACKEDGGYTQ